MSTNNRKTTEPAPLLNKQTAEETAPLLTEGPVQEILIDGFTGAMWKPDIVQLNLYRDRLPVDPRVPNERVLVSRLSMGVSALVSFQRGLIDVINEMKKQGYFMGATTEQAAESKTDNDS